MSSGLKGIFVAATIIIFNCCVSVAQTGEPLDTALIEKLTGLKGTLNKAEGVFKVSYARDDLSVKVGPGTMTTPMGLTAWTAFLRTDDMVMAMGDIVLVEDQVNPVLDAALANGLEVTALHNHFFYDQPKIMFMHIGGMDKQETIAAAVGRVFYTLKETAKKPTKFPLPEFDPSKTKLDTAKIASLIGYNGDLGKGVYKVTIGRKTEMHGFSMGSAMGVNTWAAFVGTDAEALVDGDFAMLENEVQGVLKKLRQAGIHIVAIHNHMVGETPRIVFLHYWGAGPAADLARGIRSALDTQKL